ALKRDVDRQVEERTSTLSKTYATLEAELNSRKQAEKALSQQARELGRSKDVLELHVQSRTQELQKLQRRYEHILNSAVEGIYGLDLQGGTTFVNPAAAKITGWKIQAFGDRLKSKCDAVKLQEGRDYLERMQSASARMQTLINDLLTFSRVISATQPFVPVDLAAVTREVLTDLEVRIEQTKAKIEVGDLPTIEADPLQMRQLLQNLIGNALKFQPPNAQPVVKINAQILQRDFSSGGETEPVDELCELTIQDNGIGFEEKYTDKIFAVFQRLHGRAEFEGTGVGLAVCRRITDRHGGTISALSKLGEGATFIVTLPV